MGRLVLRKKSLSEIKKSKPFYFNDLIIYFALAVLVVLLFFAVIFKPVADNFNGFNIIYNNEIIAEYNFADDKLNINDGYSAYLSQEHGGIYFYPSGEKNGEYNFISVDSAKKTVRVTDSTCAGHDCERQFLSADGGFIYCAPHGLKITAMGLLDPVTG